MEGGAVGHKFARESSPLKPLSQIKPNLAGMVPGWVTFKIVSVSAVLYPRWPPLNFTEKLGIYVKLLLAM
jgi:hypothetical protein